MRVCVCVGASAVETRTSLSTCLQTLGDRVNTWSIHMAAILCVCAQFKLRDYCLIVCHGFREPHGGFWVK